MAKDDAAAEQKPAPKTSMKQMLLAGALLMAMMIGSAGAAVVAASLVIKAPADNTADAGQDQGAADDAAATAAAGESDTSSETEENDEGEEDKADEDKRYTFEDALIVNVKDTAMRRFLRCRPVFYLASSKAKGKFEKREDELKDLLIPLLKAKTMEDLDQPNISHELGRQIMEAVMNKVQIKGIDVKKELLDVKIPELVVQ